MNGVTAWPIVPARHVWQGGRTWGTGRQLATAGALGASVLVLTFLVARLGVPLAAGGVVGVVAALLLCVVPETAALAGVAVLYANLVVAFDGSPLYPLVGASPMGLLAIPVAYHVIIRRRDVRLDVVFGLLVAYLAVLLASSFVAVDMGLALREIAQFATEGLLLYWLVVNAVRSRGTLDRVLAVTVATCALLASMTVYQTLSGHYEQQFGRLAQRALPDDEASGEPAPAPARPEAGVHLADRAAGPIGDPNRYAQILLVVLPWAAYFTRHARTAHRRVAARAAVALIAAAIALTYSRGAFLATAPLAACLLAWRYVSLARLAGLGVALACLVMLVAPSYGTRMATIAGLGALGDSDARREPDGAIRGRATEMLAGLAVFLDHPWIGVGPGQYVPSYSQEYQQLDEVSFRSLPRPREAHSLFVAIAAETGAAGLAAFALAVGVPFVALGRARRYWRRWSPRQADLAAALQLSVVGYLATGVFLHLSYERYLWFLLGLAGAALQVLRHDRGGERGSA
jgi:hypothetical protein